MRACLPLSSVALGLGFTAAGLKKYQATQIEVFKNTRGEIRFRYIQERAIVIRIRVLI